MRSGGATFSASVSVVDAKCLLFCRYNLPSDITSYDRGVTFLLQTPFLQILFAMLGSGRIPTISPSFSSDNDLLLRLKKEACFLLLFVICFLTMTGIFGFNVGKRVLVLLPINL